MILKTTSVVLLAVVVAGCSKESSAPTPETDSKAPTKAPTKAADAKAEPAKAEPAKPDAPKPAMGNDGLPSDIPTTRSAVPTLAEWAAVPKEITVARSTPLGCETKMLREWLRVSCHNKNDKGGEPTTVDTKSGGGGDTYLFAKNKVTSLVMPVLRNHHYEATFGWTDRKQLLVVDWPNGAPHPTIKFTDP